MNKETEIKKMTDKINATAVKPEEPKKQKVYHVACSEETGLIYAGVINKKGNKWLSKSDVTQEVLNAVRDHFLKIYAAEKENAEIIGYQWKTNEGKTVTVQLTIADTPKEEVE